MRRILKLVLGSLFFFSTPSFAWESHFLITDLALRDMPELKSLPAVPAESLTSFVQSEAKNLASVLQENENWAQKNIATYPALPSNLQFTGTANSPDELTQQFKFSLRINPELTFPLFVQLPFGDKSAWLHNAPLQKADVMLPIMMSDVTERIANPPLREILPGQKLTPLEIISSAADEPDYGLDTGLWSDNATAYGKNYQFGLQPFGNPTVAYSSQAPFHMGFFYESPLVYKVAGFLKRCYPEYRIHTFLSLSQLAFKTHHPYWGYRFLGWALHYAQDLVQPYHSTLMPNTSTVKLFTIDGLSMVRWTTPKKHLIQLLTNRHFALENYEYHALDTALKTGSNNIPIIKALANNPHDFSYPAYTDTYPRNIIAKESHKEADALDQSIQETFPTKYVGDPSYLFYTTEPNIDIFKLTHSNNEIDTQNLDTQLFMILVQTGSHTRNIVRYDLKFQDNRLTLLTSKE